ncbi:TM1266 family iron-only hydrogenase system putative regulator [Parasporobacterium paucivorans]|uniref:Putative iron-only hydrogenase system regulator n=1 Tax=Parasporobacterium paucivorans DSM 15970 TaxID=1122934 RepID=A0A1M6J3I0_9FIRM|nr:TM1266 family iron-only hydrogenase system putative regulator [Parasporobacterium paucivorans]SHJ41243.1 putative iron-only hydrogenase system regulator [Parasporobacterium paucivorans DSM 15970]
MESRISIISIIVEDTSVASEINELLHQFGGYIIGRMGIPCKERGISIICVVLEAPGDVVSSLSGKIGMISGVSTKTVTSKSK